jgi:putative redox protein
VCVRVDDIMPESAGATYRLGMATATLGASGYTTTVRSGRHRLVADESVSRGGADEGPTPLGMLLAALASCTAITLRMYAERKGWPLTGVVVETGYTADGSTGRVTRVIHLDGDLDADQRSQLGEVAERTPVTRIVREGREISTTLH